MKTIKQSIACSALSTLLGSYAFAQAPAMDDWRVDTGVIDTNGAGSCYAGYTCGIQITGDGFFQRQVTGDSSSGPGYFQTIITDKAALGTEATSSITFSDESFVVMLDIDGINTITSIDEADAAQPEETYQGPSPAISCPGGFTCGDIVFGTDFQQQEFTYSSNIWFQTLDTSEADAEPVISVSYTDAMPLHLISTRPNLSLQPGARLVNAIGDTLKSTPANLQLDRSLIETDEAHIAANQLSESEQKIYATILDVDIQGDLEPGTTPLVAQLNTPFNVPDGFEFKTRLLTPEGWQDFVPSTQEQVLGSQKNAVGRCPWANYSIYDHPFGKGDECIEIMVFDGGANDQDGTQDNHIELTLGFILTLQESQPEEQVDQAEPMEQTEDLDIKAEEASAEQTDQSATSEGGGGNLSVWLLLLLAFSYLPWRKNLASGSVGHASYRV